MCLDLISWRKRERERESGIEGERGVKEGRKEGNVQREEAEVCKRSFA